MKQRHIWIGAAALVLAAAAVVFGQGVQPSGALAILGANTFTGNQTFPAGSVSSPSIQIGEATSGFYWVSANRIGFAVNGTQMAAFRPNASGGFQVDTLTGLNDLGFSLNSTTGITGRTYLTKTNCASAGGTCSSAAAGAVTIAAAATTVTVATTAVTSSSEISVTRNDAKGTALSVTCNTQSSLVLGTPRVTAITTGTSFVVSLDVSPTTNPLCLTFDVKN